MNEKQQIKEMEPLPEFSMLLNASAQKKDDADPFKKFAKSRINHVALSEKLSLKKSQHLLPGTN